MCWASPSDASKSCQVALLAAQRESSRLKSVHTITAKTQASANLSSHMSSNEADRLKHLVRSMFASREPYQSCSEPSSSFRAQAYDCLMMPHARLDTSVMESSAAQAVLSPRVHSDSEGSWHDVRPVEESSSSSYLSRSAASHSSESHYGSAEDANSQSSKGRRSGRARQRTSKYWKKVRQRTPSPGPRSSEGSCVL